MEISQPPPKAWPLMAAITGLGQRSIRRRTELPKRRNEPTSGPPKAEPRSAPAQKILSPAPVMMRQRTDSSGSSSESAAFSSLISPSLIALAGGRLRVMTAKDSSRLTVMVSYAIDGLLGGGCRHAPQENLGHGLRRVHEPVSTLAQHPRRRHLIHGAEQHLGRQLDGQPGTETAVAHALFQDGGDEGEVGADLLARGTPEELLSLAELHLQHLGKVGILLQQAEVQPNEAAHLARRIGLVGDGLAHDVDKVGHLLAEEADQDVVLRLEIEIDRPRGDPRFSRDVGHAGVVVPLAGEYPHGGFDDLLRLVGIAHEC